MSDRNKNRNTNSTPKSVPSEKIDGKAQKCRIQVEEYLVKPNAL